MVKKVVAESDTGALPVAGTRSDDIHVGCHSGMAPAAGASILVIEEQQKRVRHSGKMWVDPVRREESQLQSGQATCLGPRSA